MDYKNDWKETQQKFKLWWNQKNIGRPLMCLVAQKPDAPLPPNPEQFFQNPQELYFNAKKRCEWYERYAASHIFLAEAFPNINLDFGAASAALYAGSEPICHWGTLWYHQLSEQAWCQLEKTDLSKPNAWLLKHYALLRDGKKLAAERYLVTIPDIGCSMDVMSLLRGPENLIYNMIDEPNRIEIISRKLTAMYLDVYDRCYDIVKDTDGSSAFMAFKMWGTGKVAKLECDFCALMNHEMFNTFAMPVLRQQARHMDNAFYHLDGPDAIKHLDRILTISELKAVQWTHGAGNPDGLWEGWYEKIYDKVFTSGKSLYLFIEDNPPDVQIEGIKKLVNRYGTTGIFLRFLKEMSLKEAQQILRAFPE